MVVEESNAEGKTEQGEAFLNQHIGPHVLNFRELEKRNPRDNKCNEDNYSSKESKDPMRRHGLDLRLAHEELALGVHAPVGTKENEGVPDFLEVLVVIYIFWVLVAQCLQVFIPN